MYTLYEAVKINKTSILFLATVASFLTPFIGTSLNIALPTIANELSVNAILLSWVTTSFFLTSAMFAVPLGRIADIYGMKKVFRLGIIILTFACFLSVVTPTADFLIVSRVIQGIGSAMIFVTGIAITLIIFEVYLGKVQFIPQNYPQLLISTQIAFLIFSLLGLFASLMRNTIINN